MSAYVAIWFSAIKYNVMHTNLLMEYHVYVLNTVMTIVSPIILRKKYCTIGDELISKNRVIRSYPV